MKTRIIQTRFWDDDVVLDLPKDANHLWIYLLTNKDIGMTNYIKLPDAIICFYTKLSTSELAKAKLALESTGHVFFFNGWVFIPKLEENNRYSASPLNSNAYSKELRNIPKAVKEYFDNINKVSDTTMNTTIDSTMHSTHNTEIRNKNTKIINKKESFFSKIENIQQQDKQDIADKYQVPLSFVESKYDDMQNYCGSTGKSYKDYYLALCNWVKREKLQIAKETKNTKFYDATHLI